MRSDINKQRERQRPCTAFHRRLSRGSWWLGQGACPGSPPRSRPPHAPQPEGRFRWMADNAVGQPEGRQIREVTPTESVSKSTGS